MQFVGVLGVVICCVVGRVLYFLYILQETQLQMMHSLFNDPLQLFRERFPRLISILCIFP